MSTKKFSDFQDYNKDGLVDECIVDLPKVEDPCPVCIPNPHALRVDWPKKDHLEAFMNERTCEYSIVIRTDHTGTGGTGDSQADRETLSNRWERDKKMAIEALLEAYGKDTGPENMTAANMASRYHDDNWFLDAIPNSRLKFLYTIPALNFEQLQDAPPDMEIPTAPKKVIFDVNELRTSLIKVGKGLFLYSRYLKVFQAVDGGKVYFADTGLNFDLEPYGGSFYGKLNMIMPTLREFFWERGWVLNGTLLPGFGKRDAEKIAFGFNEDYSLKYVSVWEYGCPQASYTIKKGQISVLSNKSPFNDRTALAYLANVFDMEKNLISRVPQNWLEFLQEYTYPPLMVKDSKELGSDTDASAITQALTCVADNFEKGVSDLGQEIFDEVFGLGDAIAYKFRDRLCGTLDDAREDQDSCGWFTVFDPESGVNKNVYLMAQEQAFKRLEANDVVFTELCARIFSLYNVSGGYQRMDELWANIFDKLKICGMSALLTDVIKCLLAGLSLEEALAALVRSALKALPMQSVGELFVGLPPAKQAEIEELVMRRLNAGDVPGFNPDMQRVPPPWEDTSAKDDADRSRTTGPVDNPVPVDNRSEYKPQPMDRTLAQQWDQSALSDPYRNVDPNNVLDLYVAALLDTYKDDYLPLVDLLNEFPGAPIIGFIITALDCPRPPLFDPGLFDWIKDVQLPWCRNNRDISWPRLNMAPPMSLSDVFKELLDAAKEAFLEMIMNILIAIIVKVCELLGSAICKALETVGSLAAALPSIIAGTNTVEQVIRDALCGPEASEEQTRETVNALFDQLGNGGAVLADQGAVQDWTIGVSSMMTKREIAELFTGKASDSTIRMIDEYTDLEAEWLREALPTPSDMSLFFKSVGDLFPPEFKAELRDIVEGESELIDQPVNPSLCATPERLEEFKDARCALLEGRATKEQCDKLYDDLRDSLISDLEDIGTIFQKGPQGHIADQLPPLISAPGCQDGLLPFEPEEASMARSAVTKSQFDAIKVAFTRDLIGNGPWPWQWGMVNLILSDINGLAYTTHQRKSFNRTNYVDFFGEEKTDTGPFQAIGDMFASLLTRDQGAFPVDVAGWLQDYMADEKYMPPNGKVIEPSIEWKDETRMKVLYAEGVDEYAWVKLDGYKKSDVKAKFRDNAKGKPEDFLVQLRPGSPRQGLDSEYEAYGYGFDMHMSLSDMARDGSTGDIYYKPGDWTTLRIYERTNNAFSDLVLADDEDLDAKDPIGAALRDSLSGANLGVSVNMIRPQNSRSPHTVSIQEEYSAEVAAIIESLPPLELGTTMPQVQRLVNFLGLSADRAPVVQGTLTETMNSFIQSVFETVSKDEKANPAFSYGAAPDTLSPEDLMYVNPENHNETNEDGAIIEVHEGGEPYSIPSEDAVMGVSYAEYTGSEVARRIHYLDPATFGGSYSNPGIYIAPPTNYGWLGFLDVLIPEYDGCKPRRADLVGFEDIAARVDELYIKIPDDKRLRMNPDCVKEVPYARILNRAAAAGIEGTIMVTIRIFAAIHFIKAMATFSKFKPSFPDNFSGVYAGYIIQEMEDRMKQTEPFLNIGMFKDERYWFAFLEQCVQSFGRRVDLEEIEPTADAIESFRILNDLQQSYNYPDWSEVRLAQAEDRKYLDEDVGWIMRLKDYRNLKNLHFVRKTEQYAKNIMKYLVNEQLNHLGEIFSENLEHLGLNPKIEHLGKYLLSEGSDMTAGSTLDLNQKLIQKISGIPSTDASELYTAGGEFAAADGTDYIGEYHIHLDDERGPIAMEGPFHSAEPHDELLPTSKNISIEAQDGGLMGDVAQLGEVPTSNDGQFVIEKFISVLPKEQSAISSDLSSEDIIGGPMGIIKPDDWMTFVRSLSDNVKSRNISDYYGNLEFVYDPSDTRKERPIGIKADTSIGVRYGLRLSYSIQGAKVKVVDQMIDAIDGPLRDFEEFAGSSRILYCLINNLVDSPEFKFMTQYACPLNKLLSFAAIYNSQAFLPSIGELVGDYGGGIMGSGVEPGRRMDPDSGTYDSENSGRGWEPYAKRMKHQQGANPSSWFAKGYDEWDRTTLHCALPKARSLFLSYYGARDFNWDTAGNDGIPYLLKNMREQLRPSPGQRLLPWWSRRNLRGRPLNKYGELCSSSDKEPSGF